MILGGRNHNELCMSRKNSIQAHDFSVVTNPLTNEKVVKVTTKA